MTKESKKVAISVVCSADTLPVRLPYNLDFDISSIEELLVSHGRRPFCTGYIIDFTKNDLRSVVTGKGDVPIKRSYKDAL